MKTIIKYFLVSFFITVLSLTAQVPAEIENGIRASLTAMYGEVSTIGYIYDVNKEKNEYQDWSLPITDPYGTLENCYLFAANVNDGGLIGIYKNNNLIWDSGPIVDLFNNNYGYGIVGTMDLNNDAKVEIIANWNYGVSGFIQNLWVFSWDGSEGQILNETTNGRDDNTLKSVIWSYSYVTEIIDVEGDGVYEIKGVDRKHTNSSKLYSWDGQKYGDYGLPIPEFVPMNLLTAKVTCKVNKSQYGLLYNYTVKNDSTSKQSVVRFSVEKPYESVYVGSASPNNKWLNYYSSNWDYIYNWDVDDDFHKYPYDYLLPGSSRSGLKLETATPIVYIGNYYVQGKNGFKITDDDYLFENSFIGKTICGKNADEPFVPNDFFDSLLNYNNQSYNLGWIKNEPTYNKYNTYLTNSKSALEQNNNNYARANLESILTDVDIDSSSTLTSEAYALLKFNTEYLLTQIPEEEIDTMLNNLIKRTEESYENGWIDNQGIYNSLRKKAENAKKGYEKGNEESTKNELESYQNKLKAQRGKHVTEEGYAYMFNYAETIIEQLK